MTTLDMKKQKLKNLLRAETVKIKYWFSDGSTKTWKMENGQIIKTWNTRKKETKNVRQK